MLQVVQDHHPLKWWKENSHRLPLLSKLAKKCPATSVPSERAFGLAGYREEHVRYQRMSFFFVNLKTSCNHAYRLCNLLSYHDNIDIVIIWCQSYRDKYLVVSPRPTFYGLSENDWMD